jgi:hypothetical protein
MKNCLNPYPSKVNSLAISMCKGIHVTEIPSIILWKIWTMRIFKILDLATVLMILNAVC